MSLSFVLRATVTLLLALAAAVACAWLRTPLPWMLGPLVAISVASILGAPTRSVPLLRNTGQWVIATALGLYFTPAVTALVASLWWAILLAIAWALLLGWAAARWLHYRHAERIGGDAAGRWATCFFAGAVGGASEMTVLAEREQGRSDLVAAAHTLRIVVVVLVIPPVLLWTGVHGLDGTLPGARFLDPLGLVLLCSATVAGGWLLARTGRANPWFMGPMLASMAISMAGVELSALPNGATNAAQLVIGVSLGVRFQREFLGAAPRWLVDVVLTTLGMVVLSACFAFMLGWGTHLHPGTLVLGTSPGGIVEMAITAKVLQLGVPVVTAFQVCRLVAVLVLVEPLYRWGGQRLAGPPS